MAQPGEERIQLLATALTLQPSEYVRTKWAALKHGETKEIRVAAAHNAQAIYFRLEWDDATDDGRPNDTADFPDQASVMLPIKADALIEQMGERYKPVNMWLWRADVETPYYVTAAGRGTANRHADSPLSGRGAWRDGTWSVVISRPFHVKLPSEFVVPLAPGCRAQVHVRGVAGIEQGARGAEGIRPGLANTGDRSMTTSTTAPPTRAIDEPTAARSEIYGLLADALEFPTRDFHVKVEARVFRDEVEALLGALPYEVNAASAIAGLADAGDYVPFQGDYIRLFDVGAVRPRARCTTASGAARASTRWRKCCASIASSA